MKNTSHSSPTGSLLVGMAAGAALGAVGTMAATQNQRQVTRTARKLATGAELNSDSHRTRGLWAPRAFCCPLLLTPPCKPDTIKII